MSTQVTTSFIDAFRDGVMMLVQQKGSRLRNFVTIDPGIVGKRASYDQIGVRGPASAVTSRHGDTPQTDTPHARRWLSLTDYDDADYIDVFDKLKMQFDPTSSYAQALMWSFGRSIDDVIIAAATGTAYTGVDGTSTTALSSWNSSRQLVAVDYADVGAASIGLTVAKLRQVKHIYGLNDVPEDEQIYMAVSQQQLTDLLRTDEVTNADYNTIRALVNGAVDSFMGIKFIRTQRLALNTSTDVRTCFAFTKPGIKLGMGQDVTTRISERADKRYSMQAYMSMSLGATRMEEAQVVQVLCDQSP